MYIKDLFVNMIPNGSFVELTVRFAGIPWADVWPVTLLAYDPDELVIIQLNDARLLVSAVVVELYMVYGKHLQVAELEVHDVFTSLSAVTRLYSPRGNLCGGMSCDPELALPLLFALERLLRVKPTARPTPRPTMTATANAMINATLFHPPRLLVFSCGSPRRSFSSLSSTTASPLTRPTTGSGTQSYGGGAVL